MAMPNKPNPTESEEQRMLFRWAEYQQGKYPSLKLMYHTPNGGKRSKVTAAIMRSEGVKSGVPDIFLPAPVGGYHGLYIELKRQRGGRLSVEQRKWLTALAEQGFACAVCRGYEAARESILAYLDGRWTP